jgi:hypothetical protein
MNPAIAVTRIRNGNIAIKSDSAIWLAIAQPSSAWKRYSASVAMRKLVRIECNGSGLRRMFAGDVMDVIGAAKLRRDDYRKVRRRQANAAGAINQTTKTPSGILS